MPIVFAAAYGLTVLLGLETLDLSLKGFAASIEKTLGRALPPIPRPGRLIGLLFLLTAGVTPFINSLFWLGEEIGWRGFLLKASRVSSSRRDHQ